MTSIDPSEMYSKNFLNSEFATELRQTGLTANRYYRYLNTIFAIYSELNDHIQSKFNDNNGKYLQLAKNLAVLERDFTCKSVSNNDTTLHCIRRIRSNRNDIKKILAQYQILATYNSYVLDHLKIVKYPTSSLNQIGECTYSELDDIELKDFSRLLEKAIID